MKQFYTHLIEIKSIIISLDQLDLTREQKLHLARLIDSSLHNKILDLVLSELGEGDKKQFLNHLRTRSHGKIWQLLNGKIDNIEDKIKNVIQSLKGEMEEDIKKAKKKGAIL